MESPEQQPKGRTAPANARTPNPAKVFITWKSKEACFVYYNKEKKEDVKLGMPFVFIPLEKAVTLRGYSQKKQKSFISNEVANIETDPFVVKSYNTLIKNQVITEHKGLYKDFKEVMDDSIKYTESIYAAVKNRNGELSLVNIQLNGAGLTHWFDFVKKNDIWTNAVKVANTTDEKNGAVDYKAPVFEIEKITPQDDAKAAVLQEEIRRFLKGYYAENLAKYASEPLGAHAAENQSNPSIQNNPSTQSQETNRGNTNQESGSSGNIYAGFGNEDDLPF